MREPLMTVIAAAAGAALWAGLALLTGWVLRTLLAFGEQGLPWDVDPETVRAHYKDGVLEISMKAPEKVGARKIEVAH